MQITNVSWDLIREKEGSPIGWIFEGLNIRKYILSGDWKDLEDKRLVAYLQRGKVKMLVMRYLFTVYFFVFFYVFLFVR